jgi:preprotein translocase subunit YajC
MAGHVIVAQDAAQGASPLAFLLPLIILGGLFYVLLVLPQRRRAKKMDELRKNISVGDDVRTIGGILGTIVDEDDDTFTIDIGGGQRMRIIRRAIAERIESGEA